jgi:L-amino acid N-acyltransferase YncA
MSDNAVRAMRAEDWPAVARIYQEGMDSNLATFQTVCPSWEEWDAAHQKQCRLVITRGGDVVGWAALSPYSSRSVYCGVGALSIYIGAEARGQGVGKRLLTAMIASSEEAGFWTLQSGIMENNAASVALHTSCGFRMVGYREKIGKDRFGVWRNTLLMERRSPLDF